MRILQNLRCGAVFLGTGATPDLWDRFNVVKNSVMSEPAAELHGIPGINVGYSYGTVLEQNEVYNTTWCAISMGYGALSMSFRVFSQPEVTQN